MAITDLSRRPPAPPRPVVYRQFPTAWRFALRNQARNRLAGLLLVAFVPAWYLLMQAIAGHQPLTFRLYATGRILAVNSGHLTLISAGLISITLVRPLRRHSGAPPPSAGWPSGPGSPSWP